MQDFRRVSVLAIALIVVLRMSIGWQLLYEGLWKLDTLDGPQPWSSEGYLKNAKGPFRNYFQGMTGDPDDLNWLDYAKMSQRWYDWRDRFAKHYQLSDEQRKTLDRLLDGSDSKDTPAEDLPPSLTFRQALAALPPGIDAGKLGRALRYDAERKQLVAPDAILPREEQQALSLADAVPQPDGQFVKRSDPDASADPADVEFVKAVQRLANQSRKLPFRHRLAAALRGDPENVGVTGRWTGDRFDFVMGTVTTQENADALNNVRYGKIQEYKDLAKDYRAALDRAAIDYQYEHATMLGRKLAGMRSELVGPIRALDASLHESGIKLLTNEQLARGAAPAEDSPLRQSDWKVMWGLTILGALLIAGLFTRGAAVLAAFMLLMFYLVVPPWPGVPPDPGPEHSFIVNKNLIECIALLAIAALPTGTWFGIDGLFTRLWRRFSKPTTRSGAVRTGR